jgi:hypothetical protein
VLGLIPALIEEHVGAAEERLAIPMARVFENRRWPLSIASAWVLSRNKEFVESCVRRHEPEDLGLGPVKTQAQEWRRNTGIVQYGATMWFGRRPVMLFPTVEAAAERLQHELAPTSEGLFERAEVLARFPKLAVGDCPSPSQWASVWRGSSPHDHRRITFSHAAWWIASEQGTRIIALDDRAAWKPAFDALLPRIVDREFVIYSTDPPPARPLSADLFDGIPIDYPAQALDQFAGFPYRLGPVSFIGCDLLEGDRYFTRGQDEPTHRGLQVSSTDLLKMFGAYSEPRPFTAKTLKEFVSNYLSDIANPTLDDLREQTKGRGDRKLIDDEYRRQLQERIGRPIKRGRRSKLKSPGNSADS